MRPARATTAAAAAIALLGGAALPARADVTAGGQVVSTGSCDVTLLSVTFDPATGQLKQVTGAQVDCS